jgi:hypothetical protein
MEENIMKKRKILSALCAVVLCITSIQTLTFASAADISTNETTEDSTLTGQCGDDITYVFKDGVLTLSGTGSTYYSSHNAYFAKKTFMNDIKEVVVEDGITVIDARFFESLGNLKKVTLPDSLIAINPDAFLNCQNLTDISLPSGLKYITYLSFGSCSGLKKITIPDSVILIGSWAFSDCSGLTEVTIQNGVTSIDGAAFYGCSSLTEITIPDSVTSIGMAAFNECSSLETITIENPKCELYDNENTIDSNTTIIGYANSTAYDYAVKYNRKFIDIETGKTLDTSTATTTQPTISSTTTTTTTSKKEQVTLGDINGDGSVNSIDAVFVLKDFASQILGNKSTLDLSVADMNDDGKINSSDAVIILKQYAQSLISK